jgi:hypothetical protein
MPKRETRYTLKSLCEPSFAVPNASRRCDVVYVAIPCRRKKRERKEYVKFALGLALQRLKSSFPKILCRRMTKRITLCRRDFLFPRRPAVTVCEPDLVRSPVHSAVGPRSIDPVRLEVTGQTLFPNHRLDSCISARHPSARVSMPAWGG